MSVPGAAAAPTRRAPANVDPCEVDYYDRLAASWWDLQGPFWPLHRLNALRIDYLREALAPLWGRDPREPLPLSGLDVLDVGCGGGIASEAMARLGARVHGVDVVDRNIEVARRHAMSAGLAIEYECVPTAGLARRGRAYDVVLNLEVVEHVPDVGALVNDCTRMLRPGGVLALATINRTPLSWLFAIVGAEYVLRWLPRGTHRWSRFVTPAELETLASRDGLTVTHATGVRVNPLTRHFALTRLMAVNYMLLARDTGVVPASSTDR